MPNHIDDKQSFQPSYSVINDWLSTRKKKTPSNHYVLPGFLCTSSYGWDAFYSILGLSIELGIFIFFLTKVDLTVLGNWIIFPFIIAVDLIVIFLIHANKKKRVIFENSLMFMGDEDHPLLPNSAHTIEQLRSMLNMKFRNIMSGVGVGFEWVSFCAKVYFIHLAYGLSIEPVSMAIVVGYVVQTLTYINSSGYFFSELITKIKISKQHYKFKKLGGKEAQDNPYGSTEYSLLFESPTKLKAISNTSFNLSSMTKNEYRLECFGIPMDSDIVDFALKQETIPARQEMMKQCHKIQLKKFDTLKD